jgi:hypothetical protein
MYVLLTRPKFMFILIIIINEKKKKTRRSFVVHEIFFSYLEKF